MKDSAKKYSLGYEYVKKGTLRRKKSTIGLILNDIKPKSTVLEIGTASGYMSQYLKKDLNCDVYGVELDKQCGKIASKYTKQMIVADVEKTEWTKKLKCKKFDYITFADVLEHLKEPQLVLKAVEKLLKPSGKIIFSIPNICHNSVLIDLWNNKFKYRKIGLMDNTHIRFWGIKNIKDLFENTNLSAIESKGYYQRPNKTAIRNSYWQVPFFVGLFLRFRSYGNLYQIIVTLQKSAFIKKNRIKHKNKLRRWMKIF